MKFVRAAAMPPPWPATVRRIVRSRLTTHVLHFLLMLLLVLVLFLVVLRLLQLRLLGVVLVLFLGTVIL